MLERKRDPFARLGAGTGNGSSHPADLPQARLGLGGTVWQVLKTVQARLRFVAILAVIGGTIAWWDTLNAFYEKWSRPAAPAGAAAGADTEFWCPMHPTVVRDHADKCPVCGMPLSKRRKGDANPDEALPPGVVSRVQLTPYRIALAGIRTVPVEYRPLTRDIDAVGSVEFDERRLARITARATGKSRIDKLYVNFTGQSVEKGDPLALLYSPDLVTTVQNLLDAQRSGNRDLVRMARQRLVLWGIDDAQIDEVLRSGKPITQSTIRAPMSGHVIRKYPVEGEYVEEGTRLYDIADLGTIWVEAQVHEDDLAFLRVGQEAIVTVKTFPNREFRGVVSFLHPHLDAATRTLKVRCELPNPDHGLRPGMYANVRVRGPVAQLDAFTVQRRDAWRDGTAIDLLGHALLAPGTPTHGGTTSLVQSAIEAALARQGLVLAVPESAVIDTGRRKVVYRESEPNVFDGVEAKLGPRCGSYYPVEAGLKAGDTVAGTGSFLIDAETRLTSGAGSTFFGASGGPLGDKHAATARPSMTDDDEARTAAALGKLAPEDRKAAEAQRFCPIQPENVLGTMGVPAKVVLDGQPVFLCCTRCVKLAEKDARGTLAKAAALKAGGSTKPPPTPLPVPVHRPDAGGKVGANLAKLSAEDRKLADVQGFCPIQPESRLGAMGTPVKVMLKGQPVFLCCKGCVDEALENPAQTLTKVAALKAKAAPAGR